MWMMKEFVRTNVFRKENDDEKVVSFNVGSWYGLVGQCHYY